VVGFSSSGHRRVDTAAVDGTIDEEETHVESAALGGVAGLCISEFHVVGYVIGGKLNHSSAASEGDTPVPVDTGDGQWSRFFTIRPRSVRRVRWLRRVTTSSPNRIMASPIRRHCSVGSSSLALIRVFLG